MNSEYEATLDFENNELTDVTFLGWFCDSQLACYRQNGSSGEGVWKYVPAGPGWKQFSEHKRIAGMFLANFFIT